MRLREAEELVKFLLDAIDTLLFGLDGVVDIDVLVWRKHVENNAHHNHRSLRVERVVPRKVLDHEGGHRVPADHAHWTAQQQHCDPRLLLLFVAEHVGPHGHEDAAEHLKESQPESNERVDVEASTKGEQVD